MQLAVSSVPISNRGADRTSPHFPQVRRSDENFVQQSTEDYAPKLFSNINRSRCLDS